LLRVFTVVKACQHCREGGDVRGLTSPVLLCERERETLSNARNALPFVQGACEGESGVRAYIVFSCCLREAVNDFARR
jgi:hypothetical protein